jgi:hypothetical protein
MVNQEEKIMPWWTCGSGRIELLLTRQQAGDVTHPGPCDSDVEALSKVRAVARQLNRLDPKVLADELREYGAWDEEELADHKQNLQRILWIACGDIAERYL